MFKRKRKNAGKRSQLITYSNPDSIVSDQFRAIRTNINFLTEKRKNRIFIITSPGDGEGKSTTTANLAVSMAQQKESILLIDANLRDPIIHDVFKVPNDLGLTSILSGKAKLENIIKRTGIGNLEILTSGANLFNPAELLGNEQMTELLKTVADMYDIVLIDSPPVLESTETRVLANQCDGVVLVLNRGKTELEKTVESRRVLELAHARLVGAIINEK
ncbi:CpsD/CapB family tyrosine-protein kinase [Virgibacillus necropolis]|uniref:non-specific protein-tyrosine kinase n=1 Tax=Virgibacillus necropolis TaxID=163877 RepID=A0A221MEE2_9BACI|nr:CpsD/CapB family tyrosine-protein kinase [Virgibacillus necropolis]ASN06004.1 tyrosine protein kinase [Virgibacillus necropolis]